MTEHDKIEKALEQVKLKKKRFYENLQEEGLAILKLHEKLNELNINHEFFDRKEIQIKMAKEKKVIDIINDIWPFEYQIFIEEDEKRISLLQSPISYGITNNLIEVYNFNREPVVLDHEIAAELISKKKLNSYIIAINDKTDENLEKIKEMFQS